MTISCGIHPMPLLQLLGVWCRRCTSLAECAIEASPGPSEACSAKLDRCLRGANQWAMHASYKGAAAAELPG
jgi:hypothetical protein